MPDEPEFDKVTALIKECGELMLSAHAVEKESGAIEIKAGTANFVTKYDKIIQNKLISGILQIYPEALFLAEEKENSAALADSPLLFIIDPIDGTTNFIHDMKCSVISVGVYKKGNPFFGIVYNPYFDEMFTAEAGRGAFLNGERISVSLRNFPEALVSFGTAPYYRDTYADGVFSIAKKVFMKCADLRRSGSAAYDICSVACGRTDAYFEMLLSPWDFAAGRIILAEAGGKCTDFDGKTLKCSEPSSFLCSNSLIHTQLISIIKE